MRYVGIGELARQAGLRPSALRYYESLGLLPAARREGGRRVWPAATLRRIALIRMSQRAGFKLAEIRRLLDDSPDGAATRHWRELAERKLPELDRVVRETLHLRAAVAACLACGCMNFADCELLSAAPVSDESTVDAPTAVGATADDDAPPVGAPAPPAEPARSAVSSASAVSATSAAEPD
ncbi:MerR family transcriptional regulator [Kitasatospora sp. NBC_00458]|uniref:MerR family transcriptional regulator n=1 Tax=Kitasatospora sp. NBC_00458 TaxID=2903568 RepID=UPI002E18A69E